MAYETLNLMKLNPLVLVFLAPFYLFAQPDDYCPCMEESRQYEDLMQYFSSTADVSVNVQPESYTSYYVPQESSEPAFVPMYMDVNNFPTAVAKEEEVKEEKPEREEKVASDRSGRKLRTKAKIKRKRKRLKGKLKRKKRLKKYKGGCPFF